MKWQNNKSYPYFLAGYNTISLPPQCNVWQALQSSITLSKWIQMSMDVLHVFLRSGPLQNIKPVHQIFNLQAVMKPEKCLKVWPRKKHPSCWGCYKLSVNPENYFPLGMSFTLLSVKCAAKWRKTHKLGCINQHSSSVADNEPHTKIKKSVYMHVEWWTALCMKWSVRLQAKCSKWLFALMAL